MKLVINKCFGGFSLSEKACEILNVGCYELDHDRTNPDLISVVETLGKEANGEWANLVIVELPDDVTDWEINEYDGSETVIYVRNGKLFHK